MKKFLVLQMRPEDETADAEFRAILDKGGLNADEVDRVRVEQLQVKDIDLAQYQAIIAGGSPFDISTPQDEKSETQIFVESFFTRLFDQVIPLDFPFLGACSGNGLLGHYSGVAITSKYSEPIGPVEVNITEDGLGDDLLQGFPKDFIVLAGHKEACDEVPKDAKLLITSAPCPVQMFRIKNNIYATQFHPEADEEQFSIRIDIYKNYGYFKPEEDTKLKALIKDVKTPESNEILKRFVKKYKG